MEGDGREWQGAKRNGKESEGVGRKWKGVLFVYEEWEIGMAMGALQQYLFSKIIPIPIGY